MKLIRNLGMAAILFQAACGARSELISEDESQGTGDTTIETLTETPTDTKSPECRDIYFHQSAVAGKIDKVAYAKLGKGQAADACEAIMIDSLYKAFETVGGKYQVDNVLQCWTNTNIEQSLSCSGEEENILKFSCGGSEAEVDLAKLYQSEHDCTTVENSELIAVTSAAMKKFLSADSLYLVKGIGVPGVWQEKEVYCSGIRGYLWPENDQGFQNDLSQEDFSARLESASILCKEDPADPEQIWEVIGASP